MNFFKARRDELGITQRKIARALDITESAVGMWERGETVPRLKLAPLLAPIYQVTVERIEAEIVKQSRAVQASRQPVAAKA